MRLKEVSDKKSSQRRQPLFNPQIVELAIILSTISLMRITLSISAVHIYYGLEHFFNH